MTRAFLYGTLREADLRRTVLGCDVDVEEAVIPGLIVRAADEGERPALVEAEGGTAGLLTAPLPPAALDRLEWYAAASGCRARQVEVGNVTVRAWSCGTATEETWNLDAWSARWGEVSLAAAVEAMEHYPARDPHWVRRRWSTIRTRAASRVAARRDTVPVIERAGLGSDDVDVLAERRPYTDFFSVVEHDLRFRRFDGTMSAPVTRAALIGGDAVTVLPYDPATDRVLLIEQFRFGPWARGDPLPWMLEPIAGRIDAGEGPEDTVHREAMEEAGVTLGRLERVGTFYASPGGLSELVHAFLGICDLSDFAPGIGGSVAENEDILSRVMSFERLMELVERGEVQDAPLLVTIWWLMAHRAGLRQG